jgi:BioD-like phosphotransacetylase family protein
VGVLYVVAVEKGAGKTAVCAGIAASLMAGGKKVGYLKPQAGNKDNPDSDIAFMRQVLGAADVVNAPDIVQGRDVVLVEADLGARPGDKLTKTAYGAAREMKARAIAVEGYTGQPSGYSAAYKGFGEDLLGVVLNKVPASQLKRAREEAEKDFGATGIKVLGLVPEDRRLLAITVAELAASIRGKIITSPEKSDELVEQFMLGAMTVGSGLGYFQRRRNKAAIIHQDRPDMQLAALETPTRCLVLSGSENPPLYNVRRTAEVHGIPIILTAASTDEVVAGIEESLLSARLNQVKKLEALAALFKGLDLKAVA